MEDNLPVINIIEVSSSNSDVSSSFDEDHPDEKACEIEKIEKTHKELRQKIFYQIMQFRSSSRLLINDESMNIFPKEGVSDESKSSRVQDLLKVFNDFKSSRKGLDSAKNDICKIDVEYAELKDKLRGLENQIIEKRHQKHSEGCNCSCDIF